MSWLGLHGQTAILTGAAGGLGQAIARGFAEEGARLALFDLDGDALTRLKGSLEGDHLVEQLDLSNPEAIRAAVDSVAVAVGQPGILVNIAVTSTPKLLAEVDEAEWTR